MSAAPMQVSTTSVLVGQILVMAALLERALDVVKNVEAEGSDEDEQLQELIDQGEEAIATVLREHAMPTTNPTQPKGHLVSTLTLAQLPALGAPLEGGSFAGLTTQPDGTHCAVVLLPAQGSDLDWEAAKAWAAEQGGELPSRPVAALLFANAKAQLRPEWHWTADEWGASSAWYCGFHYGIQDYYRKSYDGSAVAVRLIHVTA